eukprot:gene13330-15673_t
MKKSHKGKDRFKVKVEILVKKIINLKEYNGGSLFIQWKRGSSKTSGETSHVLVRNGEAVFEEKISFESKFFIDSKSQKPDEKKISLSLKEEKKKSSSGKVLGKIEFDLTSYMNSKPTQVVNLSFTKGIKPEPLLNYNDKPLVKVHNKADASKDPRLVKTIAGEDYFLDKTDSDVSDTADTSMASDSFNDSFGDDDPNDDLGETRKELKIQLDQLTKERDMAENESYERLQKMKELEQDLDNFKKQYKILQDDIDDKDKQIDAYQQEKETMLYEQMGNANLNGSGGISDVEILRQEKLEKMTIISNQEKEIAKLKKQVKQSQLSNSELGSLSGADIRTKYTSLQHENEELEKNVARLEREKAELQEKLNMGGIGAVSKKRADSLTSNEVGVVTKSSGSIDELRRLSANYKQELDEKILVERTIYLAEPQFKGNLSVSGINLFDGLIALGVLKDLKTGSRIFSAISMAFETTFKKCQNDNSLLAYWLSTSCVLLAKLKNKIETEGSASGGGEATALSPISSFEYQLKSIIFKFYSRLIHNTYAKLSPVLVRSILQHDIHAFNSGRLQKRRSASDIPTFHSVTQQQEQQAKSPATTNGKTQPPSSPSTHHVHHNAFNSNSLLDVLEELFDVLNQNYVHANLILQFYSQVFFYTNALLLNSLNNVQGLCSTANGFQIKIELSKVQDWVAVSNLDEALVQLEPMIETTNLLVMDKKLMSDPEVLGQVCQSIQLHQIKHLLSTFQTDRINNEPIPTSVFKAVDQLISMRSEQTPASLDIDLTYMHQLTLDFLSDATYGKERREMTRTTTNSNIKR